MRYSSTVRLINTVLFALLGAGFLFLGIWFGVVVSPYMIIQTGAKVDLPSDISYALIMELGALGLAAGIVCAVGLVFSVLSILRPDDRLVVRSFSCYMALGFVLAIFCLLNASWVYNLTSTNFKYKETGFVIAVFSILALLILIATCIPLVHMFQEEPTQNKQLKILAGALIAVDLGLLIPQGLAFLVTKKSADFANKGIYTARLGIVSAVVLAAAILSIGAYYLACRDDKKGSENKLTAICYSVALAANGGAILTAGLLEARYYSSSKGGSICSLLSQNVRTTGGYALWKEFSVISYVLAGLIFAIALIFIYFTIFPGKLKKVGEEA